MQDVTVSHYGVHRRRGFRSISRFFILLCTLAAFIHLRALDCESESGGTGLAASSEPAVKASLDFEATAYCEFGITKSGVPVSPGMVAADPRILPIGSVIRVDVPQYYGIYQVMDTGGGVKGNIIDIYIPSYDLATEFGRQAVKVTVLRYGFRADECDSEEQVHNSGL